MFTLQLGAQNTVDKISTSAEKKSHKKQLKKELISAFPGSTITEDLASKMVYHYLLNNPSSDSLTNTPNNTLQKMITDVKQDSILVLGSPSGEKITEVKIKAAERRMAIPHPNGGDWKFYHCSSFHLRPAAGGVKLMEHEGLVNMVRVTLPKRKKDRHDISTPIGDVKWKDHLFFSNQQLRNYQFNLCFPNGPDNAGVSLYKHLPAFERVDLITPARYDLFRFAPVAIYMVYEKENDSKPIFYLMEGGNGLGFCEVLYVSPTMDPNKPILIDAGYRPTSFSNSWNSYVAKTEFVNDDPDSVSIKVYTRKEILKVPVASLGKDNGFHFQIKMKIAPASLKDVADVKHFIHPATQTIQAYHRIQTLKSVGVPTTENTKVEKKYTRLTKRLTRRASRGWPHKGLEKRLNKIKLEMSDVLHPKV